MKNVLLVGDFNITSNREPVENLIYDNDLYDAWIETGHPQEVKFTYRDKYRFSRIYFSINKTVTGIKTINYSGENNDVKHLGLQVEFRL
jgi:hypothetical protein